jgi:hypothetical protein
VSSAGRCCGSTRSPTTSRCSRSRTATTTPIIDERLGDRIDEFERPPEWLDRERIEHGAALFRRFGPAVFSFAGVETLLGYTESSIVKPLALTGAYAGDTALNRFMETARFWIDVSEPGGLDPGGAGRATAMRVRIMHVFLRRRLLAHPDWDLDAWGVPISQSDALITLMSSSPAGIPRRSPKDFSSAPFSFSSALGQPARTGSS